MFEDGPLGHLPTDRRHAAQAVQLLGPERTRGTESLSAPSPWARLNLRHNPFGEPEPDEIPQLVVAPEVEELVARLRRARSAVQVLGASGRGKTARLRAIGRSFPDRPYVYLPQDGPLPGLPSFEDARPGEPALLLDEAQRLPRRKRRRLWRRIAARGASLAVAAHEDLAGELRAAGLSPRTVVVAGLDPERLAAIVDRRLEWARLEPGALPRPGTALCRSSIDRCGDDLRAILDHLYELYQDHLNRAIDGGTPRWPSAS